MSPAIFLTVESSRYSREETRWNWKEIDTLKASTPSREPDERERISSEVRTINTYSFIAPLISPPLSSCRFTSFTLVERGYPPNLAGLSLTLRVTSRRSRFVCSGRFDIFICGSSPSRLYENFSPRAAPSCIGNGITAVYIMYIRVYDVYVTVNSSGEARKRRER